MLTILALWMLRRGRSFASKAVFAFLNLQATLGLGCGSSSGGLSTIRHLSKGVCPYYSFRSCNAKKSVVFGSHLDTNRA